ncbi:hypothetical protein RRG08_026225 [Elysia crispata]|uniref:Uncharacterized protein n=1 Tax=Elysia crispata TaxID=231223 RepID=A0AAE0ZAA7_9GAST|nr:hypothetical protein RRG08_026225 [Elysia crispata]
MQYPSTSSQTQPKSRSKCGSMKPSWLLFSHTRLCLFSFSPTWAKYRASHAACLSHRSGISVDPALAGRQAASLKNDASGNDSTLLCVMRSVQNLDPLFLDLL